MLVYNTFSLIREAIFKCSDTFVFYLYPLILSIKKACLVSLVSLLDSSLRDQRDPQPELSFISTSCFVRQDLVLQVQQNKIKIKKKKTNKTCSPQSSEYVQNMFCNGISSGLWTSTPRIAINGHAGRGILGAEVHPLGNDHGWKMLHCKDSRIHLACQYTCEILRFFFNMLSDQYDLASLKIAKFCYTACKIRQTLIIQ